MPVISEITPISYRMGFNWPSTIKHPICLLILGALLHSCSSKETEWIEIPLEEHVYFEEEAIFRSDIIEIPLFAGADLEYKLGMKIGSAITYNWQATNLDETSDLLAEFHGHTIRTSDAPGDVMFYKVARTDSSSGYLVAPFDGIHGWYFSNESSSDINIVLNVSGFYELQ